MSLNPTARDRTCAVFLTALLLFSVVALASLAGTAVGTDRPASSASTSALNVTDTDPTGAFDSSSYDQQVGDVAEFTVGHNATDNLTINMTDDADVYSAEIKLSDLNDTESVTVRYNTFEAGTNDGDVVTALDEDGNSTTVDNVTERLEGDVIEDDDAFDAETRLLPGEYDLEVTPDETDTPTDAAVLTLTERATTEMNTWAAPNEVDLDDVEVEDLGTLATDRDQITRGDHLIVGVEASGIYGYAFDDDEWAGGQGLEFAFNDTEEPRYGTADGFALDDVDTDDYTVLTDTDNNQFYVVLDPVAIDGVDGVNDNQSIAAGEQWAATFGVTPDNPYSDENEAVTSEFAVDNRTVDLVGDRDDDDRLEFANRSDAPVSGITNAAPGSDLEFQLRGEIEGNTTATVDEDGVAEASLNLSDVEAGTELESVRAVVSSPDGEVIDNTTGIVVADDDPTAITLDADAPSSVDVGSDATLEVTVTNDGDAPQTATLRTTIGDDESSEEIDLDAGEVESVSYEFDTSNEVEIDWMAEAGNDAALGTLIVEEEDQEDGDDETPGFGVGGALVAVFVAAGVLRFRQR